MDLTSLSRYAMACLAVAALVGCGAKTPQLVGLAGRPDPSVGALPPVVGAYVTFHAPSRMFAIGNGRIRRRIQVGAEGKGIVTRSLLSLPTGVECLAGGQDDFSVTIGGRAYTTASGLLTYVGHDTSPAGGGSRRLRVELRPAVAEGAETPTFAVAVMYEAPKDLPVIQTWIEVRNLSETPLLVERAATQLATARPATAHVWKRGGRPGKVALPVDGSPEDGLLWLQSPTAQHGPLVVGLASAAPGALKRIGVRTDGFATITTAPDAGGWWVQPGQTISLPSAYVWASVGPLVAQAAREWTDAVDLARRFVDAARPVDVVAIVGVDGGPSGAALAATGALVCVPYAWPAAWDGDDDRAELKAAIDAVHAAGGRAGLVAPAAWLPLDGALLDEPTLALRGADGQRIPAAWHGRPGWIAALGSNYGDLALRSLVALIDELDLDAVLLDGPVSARADGLSNTGPWHAPWEAWDGLLRLVNGLKRERPDVHIGVSATTYGQDDGFDITLYPTAFLWRYGRRSEYDGMWRAVKRELITDGGDNR